MVEGGDFEKYVVGRGGDGVCVFLCVCVCV